MVRDFEQNDAEKGAREGNVLLHGPLLLSKSKVACIFVHHIRSVYIRRLFVCVFVSVPQLEK